MSSLSGSSREDRDRRGAPLSRYERRKQETRARIRQAASALFAERGVQATKVVEICERADVAHQTFFNHFPRKRDVLVELFHVGIDLVWAMMDSACQRGASTRERLTLFFGDVTRSAAEAGPMARELTAEVIRSQDEEQARRLPGIFLELVQRGIEEGDVTRRYEPEVLAELVYGALATLMTDWVSRTDLDVSERSPRMASLVADALERRPGER
ncbi:MAG: TetR/AcrR family transcriptional regulator [Myxococcota bacterium]|nr:TetR/AcrR family transcriptional regulator [Myxococcota bacterium]